MTRREYRQLLRFAVRLNDLAAEASRRHLLPGKHGRRQLEVLRAIEAVWEGE